MIFYDLIPAVAITAGPVLVLAPVVYALRPQGGTRWLRPTSQIRPAAELIAELRGEVADGKLPADLWGDASRPSLWTVPAVAR